MKSQTRIILVTVFLSVLMWSCAKEDGVLNSNTLKQSVNQSAKDLNNAMDVITSSKAYNILTVNDITLKSASISDSLYRVYIPLDNIKGVYDYHPVTTSNHFGSLLTRFFTKTVDDNLMVVRMPLSKVENPRTLRQYHAADSALINNFSISVSEYHNNYNSYWDFDYILKSEISVDNVVAGNLNINSFISPAEGKKLTSQYVFAGGYTAEYKYTSGDTIVSSFAIASSGNVLYEEKRLISKNELLRFGREFQYILTIGDVQIVRKSGTTVVEVSVNGVLQSAAVVEIIDNEVDLEASVCKKRDVKITFDDGTSTTVSALIGTSVGDIRTLFDSLHQVFFAAYVVDWIAYDIYYQRD